MTTAYENFHPGHRGLSRQYLVIGANTHLKAHSHPSIPKLGSLRFVRGMRAKLCRKTTTMVGPNAATVVCDYESTGA